MLVHCPQCGQSIQAADVNLDHLLGKCARCDHVFGLQPLLRPQNRPALGPIATAALSPADVAPAPAVVGSATPAVSSRSSTRSEQIPPKMQVTDDGRTWRLSWRWWEPSDHAALALFAVIWNGFLLLFCIGALAGTNFANDNVPHWTFFLAIPGLHIIVGIALGYYVIAASLNRTRVSLDRYELRIRHGPVPWWGNRRIIAGRVRRILKERDGCESNGKHHYLLCMVLDDNEKHRLVSGLPTEEHASFLREELTGRLGLPDAKAAAAGAAGG